VPFYDPRLAGPRGRHEVSGGVGGHVDAASFPAELEPVGVTSRTAKRQVR
jgi:hypothetical protein